MCRHLIDLLSFIAIIFFFLGGGLFFLYKSAACLGMEACPLSGKAEVNRRLALLKQHEGILELLGCPSPLLQTNIP